MANVLVYAELAEGRPSTLALAALGEARRIASAIGATVYAVLACAELPRYGDDDAIALLGRHGADKVILLTAPGLGRPTLFATHGPAVVAACEQLPPALLLFPSSVGGSDVAPRVAARLGAAFAARPRIDISGDNVVLSRPVHGGVCERRLAIEDIERPVVLTYDGPAGEPCCDGDAEVVVLTAPPVQPAIHELPLEGGAQAPVPPVRVVLLIGRAAIPDPLERRLRALGARVVVDGVPWEAPHSAVVVAVQTDPEHPVFQQARFGLLGEPADVMERLAGALADAAA
ncbi:MAG TPA: hypothetical protein VKN99_23645 [Polyangia bacterium]|nr:hypothetical protein [Polyangia bacterium]